MKKILILTVVIISALISCKEEETIEKEIKPEACFSLDAEENKVGSEIILSNCSQNSTHYYWTFGDGESSTQNEPSHIFKKQGTYEIRLLAGEDKNQDGVLNILDDVDSLKKTITIAPNHLAVELTILTTANWTIENPVYEPVPNAVVSLYKTYPESLDLGVPDYTMTTDNDGKLKIYDEDIDAVCFIVENNSESNIVDGYLIGGVFETQEEVDNWPYIDDATVGSYKYLDLNGDGIINSDDKASCQSIIISLESTYTKNVYLGE